MYKPVQSRGPQNVRHCSTVSEHGRPYSLTIEHEVLQLLGFSKSYLAFTVVLGHNHDTKTLFEIVEEISETETIWLLHNEL